MTALEPSTLAKAHPDHPTLSELVSDRPDPSEWPPLFIAHLSRHVLSVWYSHGSIADPVSVLPSLPAYPDTAWSVWLTLSRYL